MLLHPLLLLAGPITSRFCGRTAAKRRADFRRPEGGEQEAVVMWRFKIHWRTGDALLCIDTLGGKHLCPTE